jgi:tripartite-type tricarboxylate transporter receptor subunit TctC
MIRRRIAAAFATLAVAVAAHAQSDYPSHTVTMIVPFPPGGVADITARPVAEAMGRYLKQAVVVENRAGAGGMVGMEIVAKARPDGYSLGFCAISPLALSPHLAPINFDPVRDIAPVASVMYTPVLVAATPTFEGRTFADLVAVSRAKPGSIRWATSGLATIGHLVLEEVKRIAGVAITHIPYKGGGQQITDALGGQFEILSTNLAPAQVDYVKAGRLRALAVGSPTRSESLPDVPTLAELGFASANLVSLFGVFAPGRTPGAVVARLNSEINKVLETHDFRSRVLAADNTPSTGTASDFARLIATASEENARIVRAAGLR